MIAWTCIENGGKPHPHLRLKVKEKKKPATTLEINTRRIHTSWIWRDALR